SRLPPLSLHDALPIFQKFQRELGPHAQAFIRRSPFLCLGTQDRKGRADVSPRGDPPGFVRILDSSTLAIPDRPGNNRLDSLSNIDRKSTRLNSSHVKI